MTAIKDIAGQIFGRLYVSHLKELKNTRTFWYCWCACGNTCVVNGNSLRRGKTTSCGCFGKEQRLLATRKHGDSVKHSHHNYIYSSWKGHLNHIFSDKTVDRGYHGMPIDPIWRDSYPAFKEYVLHILGERPSPTHTLDIINHNLGFVRGNLRWATKSEQNKNRRNLFTAQPIDLFNRILLSCSGTVS